MTPAKTPPSNVPTIGAHGFGFCDAGNELLLEVRAAARVDEVREQAYPLIQSIEEVLGRAIASGAIGSEGGVLDTPKAYILRFAADAAAAMVGSLGVK